MGASSRPPSSAPASRRPARGPDAHFVAYCGSALRRACSCSPPRWPGSSGRASTPGPGASGRGAGCPRGRPPRPPLKRALHAQPQQRPRRRPLRVLRVLRREPVQRIRRAFDASIDLHRPHQLHPREPRPVVVVDVHQQRRLGPAAQVAQPRRVGACASASRRSRSTRRRPRRRTSPAGRAGGRARRRRTASPPAPARAARGPSAGSVSSVTGVEVGMGIPRNRPSVHPARQSGAVPSTKLVIGGAAAGAAIGVRVARTLHGRWRLLPEADRNRIARLAQDTKEKALDLRGADDRERAEADLRAANETLAAALVETAESDPQVAQEDVDARLRRASCGASWGGSRAARRTLRLREPGANAPSRLSRIGVPRRDLPREYLRPRPHLGAVGAPQGGDARVRRRDEALPGPGRARGEPALAHRAGRRDLRAGRPVRLREDHRHADGQPDDEHHRGRHPARRPERPRPQPGRAAARASATRSSRSGSSRT